MKKLVAVLILFSLVFSGTETFALTGKEAANLDLTTPCGFSAEENYGVNALFLCAVSALESGWGKYCFRKNNIFGWSGKDFETKAECIDFVASKIAEHYLSEDGKYYNGKTVSGVNVFYNGNLFWEEKISGIMSMISRKIALSEIG